MGEVIHLKPVKVAPVEVKVVKFKPYVTKIDPASGVVDTIVAGYIDKSDENKEIVPLGKVSTVPCVDVLENIVGHAVAREPTSRIDGFVGEEEVFSRVSPIGFRELGCDPVLYEPDEIANYTRQLQREAAQVVLSHLGIRSPARDSLKKVWVAAKALWH